jgi:hypothetical protein
VPCLRPLVLIACLTVAPSLCSGVTGARGAGRSRCSRFAGPRLARNRSLEVIERPVGEEDGGLGFEEMLLFACVPPAGHVWLVGIARDPGSGGFADASVTADAGPWAVIQFHDNQTPHESEDVYKLIDVRTGTSRTFFREDAREIPGFEAHEGLASIQALKLNPFGQLLLEIGDGAQPPRGTIIAEQPGGRRRRLDAGPLSQIPATSLSLAGHTARWTDASGRHAAGI